MTRRLPTVASATNRRSTSSWWLFSALAIADCSTFFTSPAMRRLREGQLGQRRVGRLAADRPATRFSLRGLVRSSVARPSPRCRPAAARPWLAHAYPLFAFLSARVAVEGPGRRELAELVADHVLGHQHRDELLAVVDAEGQPDELRQDGRAPRPGLDDLVAAGAARLLAFFSR